MLPAGRIENTGRQFTADLTDGAPKRREFGFRAFRSSEESMPFDSRIASRSFPLSCPAPSSSLTIDSIPLIPWILVSDSRVPRDDIAQR